MKAIRFDFRTFALIGGAALLGAAWASYNRGLVASGAAEHNQRALVWIIFATPFATFWGWLIARRSEGWWAALVCFCIYFFSVFVSARYESCTVVQGVFSLTDCFTAMEQAREIANRNGHTIYFATIVIIQLGAGFVLALQRALSRSTIPIQAPLPKGEPS